MSKFDPDQCANHILAMRSERKSQEGLMQIRNATYDRQLDLLDCRMTMLGLDLYAIENDQAFEELRRCCLNCECQEVCTVDLRRDPNNPIWETYCPNAATLSGLAEAQW